MGAGAGGPIPARPRIRDLLGRSTERALLEAFTATVRDGLSAALVLVGPAGIGKTRLLEHVAGSPEGLHVARTCGLESETHLGFAGLHRLLRPFLGRLDRLPDPQRTALATAFGLVAGPPPDLFLVGLAALTLLADAAHELPLVCLVDDAQWLDRESLAALGFLGRRLDADGIGLLVAVRDDPGADATLPGLPVHALAGLDDDAAGRLVAVTAGGRAGGRPGGRPDEQVVARIVAGSGGNPLALIETSAALSSEQLNGTAVLPDVLPIGSSLEAHFAAQVAVLPPQTRLFLLLVAAAPPDDHALLWRAAGRLGLAPAAPDAAVSGGFLLAGRRYALRHPLIRSAVYATAPPGDRRAVHRALGEAVDADLDPDARAWHLAESVAGLDEALAADLEQASERARDRGGLAARAALLSRAAELTPEPSLRARRFLDAALTYVLVGDLAAAGRQLDLAAPGLRPPALQAAGQRARAAIEWYGTGVVVRVPAILLDALARCGPLDDRTVRAMLWEALTAGLMSGRCTQGVTLREIADAALTAPPSDPARPRPTDLLLDAFATRLARGYEPAVPLLRAGVAALRTGVPGDVDDPSIWIGAWAALDLWDDEGFAAALRRIDAVTRAGGALNSLKSTLSTAATGKVLAGRFVEAQACHTEAGEIEAAMGLRAWGSEHVIELLAWQGREEQTRAAAEVTERVWVDQLGYGVLGTHAARSLAVLELGLGRYREALDHAARVVAEDLPGQGSLALSDVVEAGVRAGDRPAAEAALATLARRATASGTPWALGVLARSRALLAADAQAEALYREALDRLGRTSVRTEVARTHLLLGEWLRRRGRRGEAREPLRAAHDLFAAMGAAAFAERARVELRATGESARRRSTPAPVELTPRERQVAVLAAEGATNAEIATRLFVTASTVEFHLNKIFRKLDVTSRRQLTPLVRDDPAQDPTPTPTPAPAPAPARGPA